MWEVERNHQHSRCVLAMVCHTLAVSHKGKPIVVYGASFVNIPAHQARMGLSDALKYLASAWEDCIVLGWCQCQYIRCFLPSHDNRNTTHCCPSTVTLVWIVAQYRLLLLPPCIQPAGKGGPMVWGLV